MNRRCRVTAAVIALSTIAVLSACAGAEPTADDTSDPSVSVDSSPSGPAQDEVLPCVPGVQPFTGEAADELGADRVMAAYCGIVEFIRDDAFTSLVVPGPERSVGDYAFVREHLSAPARRRWDEAVRQYLASADPRSFRTVNGLTLHDVPDVPDGYLIPPSGPYSYGTQIGPAQAALARDGSLTLRLEVTTGVVLEEEGDDSGRHSLLPVTRRVAYGLVPASRGDGWLIDDWRATYDSGTVRLATRG